MWIEITDWLIVSPALLVAFPLIRKGPSAMQERGVSEYALSNYLSFSLHADSYLCNCNPSLGMYRTKLYAGDVEVLIWKNL